MTKEKDINMPVELREIKKKLQDKPFDYILDFLFCSPYLTFQLLARDKSFLEGLRKQCTSDGFEAFKTAFYGYGKILKKRQDEGRQTPSMQSCANNEISIDGGLPNSKSLEKYQKDNPTLKSCIALYDIVQVNRIYTYIPNKSKGVVVDIYPPSGSNIIQYLVEIPIYTVDNELFDVEMENIPSTDLTLLKRWDNEKKEYVTENLDKPVITFNDYGENWGNQFQEKNFGKKQTTLADGDREPPNKELKLPADAA